MKLKDLQEQNTLLTQEMTAITKQRDTALQIANFLVAEIFQIEKTIEESSFKGNPKRPLFFIIKNYKEIIKILELVIASYKKVREALKDLTSPNESYPESTELPARQQ